MRLSGIRLYHNLHGFKVESSGRLKGHARLSRSNGMKFNYLENN